MIKAFKNESLKLRKSITFRVCLFLFTSIYLISCLILYENFQPKFSLWSSLNAEINPWNFYIHTTDVYLKVCLGSIALLIVTWMHYEEEDNNMWSKNLTLPISVLEFILVKILVVFCFVILLEITLFLVNNYALKKLLTGRYTDIFSGKDVIKSSTYYQWFFHYIITMPKLIIFHFWLTLKLRRSYLLAFLIGFIALMIEFSPLSPYQLSYVIGKEENWTVLGFTFLYSIVFIYLIKKEIQYLF